MNSLAFHLRQATYLADYLALIRNKSKQRILRTDVWKPALTFLCRWSLITLISLWVSNKSISSHTLTQEEVSSALSSSMAGLVADRSLTLDGSWHGNSIIGKVISADAYTQTFTCFPTSPLCVHSTPVSEIHKTKLLPRNIIPAPISRGQGQQMPP